MAYRTIDNQVPPHGPGFLQFSLTALFLVMTIVAVVFSAFFGIGHLLGMSTLEVATQGMARLVFSLPMILVWTLGLAVAVQRRRQNPLPAKLCIIALSGMTVMLLASQIVQMVMINGIQAGWLNPSSIGWYFGGLSIVAAVLNTVFWVLILTAIFVDRAANPRTLIAQTRNLDPFADDEPVAAAIIEEDSSTG